MESKIKKEKLTTKLTVSLSASEMEVYFNKAYEKLAPTVKLDGFRPGKAPRKLVEASLGTGRVLSEALNLAIDESYLKALKENDLFPVSQPKIVINKYPSYGDTEKKNEDNFEFEAEFEVMPEVKLGDYQKLKVELPKEKKASEEDVEKVVKHLQKQAANLKEKDGAAEKGDRVEINFEGSVGGVRKDAMCSKNHPAVLGEGGFIPGFEDNIIGKKKGEKTKFKIKFPANYHAKDLAGKDAEFEVEVLDVKEVELPEVNEVFAQKFGHKNEKDLKKAIKKNLDMEYEMENKRGVENAVIEKILPLMKVEIPQSLVQREMERMEREYSESLAKQGIQFEKYLESTKKTPEDFRKVLLPQAEKNVKIGLLLGKIIEDNKFDRNDPKSGEKAINFLVSKLTK